MHDLSKDSIVQKVLQRIKNKEFIAAMIAPPCNTHSRAQFSDNPGPNPLRTKEHPHGVPNLSAKLKNKVKTADKLIKNSVDIAEACHTARIPYLIEHPENLGATPKGTPASIWDLASIRKLAESSKASTAALYQCQNPSNDEEHETAQTPKPTRMLGTAKMLKNLKYQGWPQLHENGAYQGPLPRYCGHKHPRPLIGFDKNTGNFRTEAAAAYPPALCRWIAKALTLETVQSSKKDNTTVRDGGKKLRDITPTEEWDTSDEDELGERKWKLGSGQLRVARRERKTKFKFKPHRGACTESGFEPGTREGIKFKFKPHRKTGTEARPGNGFKLKLKPHRLTGTEGRPVCGPRSPGEPGNPAPKGDPKGPAPQDSDLIPCIVVRKLGARSPRPNLLGRALA